MAKKRAQSQKKDITAKARVGEVRNGRVRGTGVCDPIDRTRYGGTRRLWLWLAAAEVFLALPSSPW